MGRPKKLPKAASLPTSNSNMIRLPDAKDPFDGLPRPAKKNMIEMMKWHQRIPPNELPTFLNEYRIQHFIGAEKKENAMETVYELYHTIFDDPTDRKEYLACFNKGETITICEPEKRCAISAITFLRREDRVLVLYFATAHEYQSIGMGTFLLSIMHQLVESREPADIITVYLKANPKENKSAWDYYANRGFYDIDKYDDENIPQCLINCFINEDDNSPLKNYFQVSTNLFWLKNTMTRQDFQLPPLKDRKPVLRRMYNNPNDNTIDFPSVYAAFPGKLTPEEIVHCKPDYNRYSAQFWDDVAFHASAENASKNLPYNGATSRLTWIERCFTRYGESFTPNYVDIALGWLQRNPSAIVWSTTTIIPNAIMTEVLNMQTLYKSYVEAMELKDKIRKKGVASTPKELRPLIGHIFHFDIDPKRFMNASIPVVEYILRNKDLFTKPFIAMTALDINDDEEYFWSAFIAVNCARIKKNGKDKNGEEVKPCGFIMFHPNRKHEESFVKPPMTCLFFLKFAHFILNPKNDSSKDAVRRKKLPNSEWANSILTPYFSSVRDFFQRFRRRTLNFGCINNDEVDDELCDIKHGHFKRLTLPENYALLRDDCFGENMEQAIGGVKSVIFIHDFCKMIYLTTTHEISFDEEGNVKGMGIGIPPTKRKFKEYVLDLYVSIFQMIDRIADTNIGSDRKGSDEYKEYLLPKKSVRLSIFTGGKMEMPKVDKKETFPDLANYSKWLPLTRKAAYVDTGGEEVDVETMNTNDVLTNRLQIPPGMVEKGHVDEQEASNILLSINTYAIATTTDAIATTCQAPAPVTKIPTQIAQTTATVSQHSEYVPSTEHVTELVSRFQNEFTCAESEDVRNDVGWHVIQLLHKKDPLPFVDDTLKCIRHNLEKGKGSVSTIVKVGEKDVLCGRGQSQCIKYLERTTEMKSLYLWATGTYQKSYVAGDIYTTLRKEGFRFLDAIEGNGCFQEREKFSAIAYVHQRMKRLCGEKDVENIMASTNVLEAAPGPFETASIPRNGIVHKKGDEPKKHNPNKVYRFIIKKAAKGARFESGRESERKQIANEVMEEIEKKDFIFIDKNEQTNEWKKMDTKSISCKILKALRKANRSKGAHKVTRKRKSTDITKDNSVCEIEGKAVETDDDEDAMSTSDEE
jgi:hypothetical protein